MSEDRVIACWVTRALLETLWLRLPALVPYLTSEVEERLVVQATCAEYLLGLALGPAVMLKTVGTGVAEASPDSGEVPALLVAETL